MFNFSALKNKNAFSKTVSMKVNQRLRSFCEGIDEFEGLTFDRAITRRKRVAFSLQNVRLNF